MPEKMRVIVTGAAVGIGAAIAHTLAKGGADLILVDRDAHGLEQTEAAVRSEGSKVKKVAVDVTDTAAIPSVMAAADTSNGLVNCAGIYPVTPTLELSPEEWDRVLNLNLRTPFFLSQAFAREMVAKGRTASIVNISSTASVLARPGIAHYGTSKAGLNQMTRVLAVELAPHGIRVNAVLPGVIETETVKASQTTPAAVKEMATKMSRIPMRRLGTPEEVAEMVRFLLSPAASYVTGALITADGGFSLGIASY